MQQLQPLDDQVVVPAEIHTVGRQAFQRSGPRPRSSIDPRIPKTTVFFSTEYMDLYHQIGHLAARVLPGNRVFEPLAPRVLKRQAKLRGAGRSGATGGAGPAASVMRIRMTP